MIEQDYIPLNIELQQLITTDQAWHYSIIPKQDGSALEFFVADSKGESGIEQELEVLLGKRVKLDKQPDALIQKTLGRYYLKGNAKETGKLVSLGTQGKADDFAEKLIMEAKSLGSSDIHIEAYEERSRVRMRIDGVLVERYTIDPLEYPALVNKIKIKSNMDIAEKRLPQDGRIFFEKNGDKIDIRVSVLPTLHGEKVVMRLLNKDATDIDIEELGMNPDEKENYLEGIKRPNGIVLISGPTGSGKTTTLYATLKILNKIRTNLVTIEDPIEYTLEGINQVQLKESIGLTFASALRTFLRQDPDVIMLGEIRDGETAQMAIRASLTGHLVLSTIHTNSAWGTISRLIDMGVPPYLLASTLNTTVAQRLLRLLCKECKEEVAFTPDLLPKNVKLPQQITSHYKAVGCESCYYTGYKGRTAIYEVISIDHELSERIKTDDHRIEGLMKERKIKSLSENALDLFTRGETTAEEVYPILLNAI